MKITCFHEPWTRHDAAVVALWRSAWAAQGWEPQVLSLKEAQSHPLFSQLTCRVFTYPSVNDFRYEALCYLRWCAYALVGGIVCDYDVFPRMAFPPRSYPRLTTGCFCGSGVANPAFVSGDLPDYERILQMLLTHQPRTSHVSDMVILQANTSCFERVPLMNDYGEPGWDTMPLVHFGNSPIVSRKAHWIELALRQS